MKNIAAFKSFISQPKNVVIVTHFKPDADALGSSLGWAGFLEKKGHRVTVITPSDYPDFLAWMPGNEKVVTVPAESKFPTKKAIELIEKADAIFCIDFSGYSRINTLGDPVKNSAAPKIMIDHHLEPEKFGEFEQWDAESASSAGLIFELIDELGDKDLIDKNIANCLYAGLMTDTGGFRHSNVRQKEFLIASELVSQGANPSLVSRLVYDANTVERLRLTGYVLSQKLFVLPEFKTAYMSLNAEELRKFGTQTGDTEGLVNYGLSIRGIKMSVFLYERRDEIKFSFRSLGDFSVNGLARKHFAGGGHRNASGGSSKTSLEDSLKKFLRILPEYKDELNKPF
jgi:bifunctional oligoribonuclease and PAP phosphatase NrnA